MKKILSIFVPALFLVACSGSPDQGKESATDESATVEQQTIVDDETIQSLENTANNIADEAEELATEVESLIDNL